MESPNWTSGFHSSSYSICNTITLFEMLLMLHACSVKHTCHMCVSVRCMYQATYMLQ